MTVGEDARAQSAPSTQRGFRSRRNDLIHPMTGPAFLDSREANSLHREFLANESIEVGSRSDDVSSRDSWRLSTNLQLRAKLLKHFEGEESNLAFIIFFVIKESVSFDSAPSQAMNFRALQNRIPAGRPFVMAEEIMAGRNKKLNHTNIRSNRTGLRRCTADYCSAGIHENGAAILFVAFKDFLQTANFVAGGELLE